jgi:hypothetical protein
MVRKCLAVWLVTLSLLPFTAPFAVGDPGANPRALGGTAQMAAPVGSPDADAAVLSLTSARPRDPARLCATRDSSPYSDASSRMSMPCALASASAGAPYPPAIVVLRL